MMDLRPAAGLRPAVRTPWSLLTDQWLLAECLSFTLGCLRLSRLCVCHKGQLLWTDELSWTVTSICVPASLFRQHLFDFVILYYCLKASCCFILSFLFWLLSFGLFFLFFFFSNPALHCCLFALFSVFYGICMLSDFNLVKRLVKSLSERCYISRVYHYHICFVIKVFFS